MGYQITLSPQDMIKAAKAAIQCQMAGVFNHLVKGRDAEALMMGMMAQQAVGRYHYQNPDYDVSQWVFTGTGDTIDGYEIRCNPHRNLWIRSYDQVNQPYWLMTQIAEHRFWLLGEVHRQDVEHLAESKESWGKDVLVRYNNLLPHLRETTRPMNERMRA